MFPILSIPIIAGRLSLFTDTTPSVEPGYPHTPANVSTFFRLTYNLRIQ